MTNEDLQARLTGRKTKMSDTADPFMRAMRSAQQFDPMHDGGDDFDAQSFARGYNSGDLFKPGMSGLEKIRAADRELTRRREAEELATRFAQALYISVQAQAIAAMLFFTDVVARALIMHASNTTIIRALPCRDGEGEIEI